MVKLLEMTPLLAPSPQMDNVPKMSIELQQKAGKKSDRRSFFRGGFAIFGFEPVLGPWRIIRRSKTRGNRVPIVRVEPLKTWLLRCEAGCPCLPT